VFGSPTILHADLDAFFASVEQRDAPHLRGRPVVVGGGVVLAASYEARAYGVRSAMAGGRARRLCPRLVVVPPRWSAYVEASRAVFALFARVAPLVEPLSIDEAFLDVRGLERISGTPPQIAARLRRDVREQVGLPITVGVARTKFLAKVASGVAKPDGLLVVAPERELAFLHPLGVEKLWGVGPATAEKLRRHGLRTVADVARLPEAALVALLGRAAGRQVHALAHNRDRRPVRPGRGRRSVGAQCALGRSPRSFSAIDGTLVALVDRVTRRMRAGGWRGRTVVLRLRFGDFSRATRSRTLARPTAATRAVLLTARALLAAAAAMLERRGLTLIGVTVTDLSRSGAGAQLALPLEGRAGDALDRHAADARFDESAGDALDAVLDDVRARFGPGAVTRATLLGRDPLGSTWLFPGEEPDR